MEKVLVTLKVPELVYENLKNNFTLIYNDSMNPLSKKELIEKVKDVNAILCPLSEKIDREIMEAGKNLKIIANFGAGFDNIDIDAANDLGIIVTNSPAVNSTSSTSELTMGIMIDIMRNITSGEKDLRKGNFKGWKPVYGLGNSLSGKTLGIIGTGRIGKDVARKARAFDMNLIYYNRTRLDKDIENEYNLSYKNLDELIEISDVITIHTAYSDDLKHLFNEETFNKMKTSSYLINASRGPIVEEKALIHALNNNIIKGAALDVYEFEPNISEDLLNAKNILLVPHLGNATYEARNEMGLLAFENIKDVLSGKPAKNKVN